VRIFFKEACAPFYKLTKYSVSAWQPLLKSLLHRVLSGDLIRGMFPAENLCRFGIVKQQVFLSLGSNSGNRQDMLSKAREQIGLAAGKLIKVSSIYETAPWGNTRQPLFLNQVLEIQTTLEAPTLLDKLQEIERTLGRVRGAQRWQERTIDIDILFYGTLVFTEPGLQIPHRELANRRFVLQPMHEIAPKFVHPQLKLSISELLNACIDSLEVRVTDQTHIK
jgi:2-amino-4-hydroxy-6-hydroxymethyldihydropteridine diphosphokinase